jgi:hypothetical protein
MADKMIFCWKDKDSSIRHFIGFYCPVRDVLRKTIGGGIIKSQTHFVCFGLFSILYSGFASRI